MKLAEAKSLGEQLIAEHLSPTWRLQFFMAYTTCGKCVYSTHTIKLSKPYVLINDENEVWDTILHEIAHALVGKRHHHDKVWRQKATEIGARPETYSSMAVAPAPRWDATCPKCHTKYSYYRKARVVCKKCHVPFEWRQHEK